MPGGTDIGPTGTPVPEEDGQADGTSADAQAEDEIGSAAEAVIRATDFSEWQQAAEEAAQTYGVTFLHRDFRPYFKEGQEKARELDIYMQKYCGCVFSEEERYLKKNKIIP